jgi:hypothetical protein
MKIFIPILFLICFWSAGYSQRVQSSCTWSDSATYIESAAKMAYEYMLGKDSSYADSSNAPQSLRDTLLRALNAVYNSGLEYAKEVTGRVKFASNPVDEFYGGTIFIEANYYSFRRIRVTLDTSIIWQKKLLRIEVPTGNLQVDNFLLKYGLTIDTINSWWQQHPVIWLTTMTLQNTLPIARVWNIIPGNTAHAEPDNFHYYWNGGTWLNALMKDSTIILNYGYSWGDCPAGCIWGHSWIFKIFSDCSVESEGSFGSDFVKNAVQNPSPKNGYFSVHPNPSSNKITIESQPQSQIEIIDVTGKIIQRMQTSSDQEEMDISQLPKGIYLIRAFDKKGNINTAKFVKE